MSVLKSLLSAFAMYSRIPVPRVEWREENRRYALCFFPVIGAVIGGLLFGWSALCERFGLGGTLFAAVACVIPIAVSGGIHLDGFCDVIDAQNSHAERSRKLEIMSDPHIGSFAAIGLGIYFLIQLGLFSQLYTQVSAAEAAAVVGLGYVLSRALSGLAAVTFKSAKSDGALQSFAKPAHKRVTVIVLSVIIAATCAGMALIDLIYGAAAILAAGGAFLFYRIFAYKEFDGITGDLAGFFLQICELAILAAVVIAGLFAVHISFPLELQ